MHSTTKCYGEARKLFVRGLLDYHLLNIYKKGPIHHEVEVKDEGNEY